MVALPFRKPRRTTYLPARLRDEYGWTDVVVCNVSEGGLMLRGTTLPRRGEFVEIQCGPLCITAQVRWSHGSRCGVRSRERIDVGLLLGGASDVASARDAPATARAARRPTLEERAERARVLARWINLGLTLCLVVAGCALLGGAVLQALKDPFDRLSGQLGASRSERDGAGKPGRADR